MSSIPEDLLDKIKAQVEVEQSQTRYWVKRMFLEI